jgi:hypothetical protein
MIISSRVVAVLAIVFGTIILVFPQVLVILVGMAYRRRRPLFC